MQKETLKPAAGSDFEQVALPRFFDDDGKEIFPPYEMTVTRSRTGEAPQVAVVSRLT